MINLQAKQLHVEIAGKQVVNDLNLDFKPGQIWAVLGPNGIGKTTLLKTFAGLMPPDNGQVLLDKQNILNIHRRLIAKQMGMLQQHTAYVFDATVLQTVLTGRHPHLAYWEREHPSDFDKARAALHACDLQGLEQRSVMHLSGGEARRLAFASLMVQETDILLLDEPTNHLDPGHQLRLMEILKAQATTDHKTIICALHDVNLAASYCSHVLMLFGDGDWCAGETDTMLGTTSLQRLYDCPIQQVVTDSAGPRYFPMANSDQTNSDEAGTD